MRDMSDVFETDTLTKSLNNLFGAIERRREQRFASDTPVIVYLFNPAFPETASARILDISKSGVRLRMDMQLFPGMEVQILIGNIIAFGEIRYAKPIGVDFDHGVAVREVRYAAGGAG